MKKVFFLLLMVMLFLVGIRVSVFAEGTHWSTAVDSAVQSTQNPTMSTSELQTFTSTTNPIDTNATSEPGAVPPTSKPTSKPTASATVEPTSVPSATAATSPKGKTLANAKKAAKKELKKYLNLNNYEESEQKLIKDLLRAANKDINGLKSKKQIKEYLKVAKKILKDIPVKEEVEGSSEREIKFLKKIVRVEQNKTVKIKVIVNSDNSAINLVKKVRWSISKKGNKVVKFTKKASKLKGRQGVRIKAVRKGKAKIICKLPTGKKAVCTVLVW